MLCCNPNVYFHFQRTHQSDRFRWHDKLQGRHNRVYGRSSRLDKKPGGADLPSTVPSSSVSLNLLVAWGGALRSIFETTGPLHTIGSASTVNVTDFSKPFVRLFVTPTPSFHLDRKQQTHDANF